MKQRIKSVPYTWGTAEFWRKWKVEEKKDLTISKKSDIAVNLIYIRNMQRYGRGIYEMKLTNKSITLRSIWLSHRGDRNIKLQSSTITLISCTAIWLTIVFPYQIYGLWDSHENKGSNMELTLHKQHNNAIFAMYYIYIYIW